MQERLPYISSIEEWDTILRDKPADRDLVVFKVSPICNMSHTAEQQVDRWLAELPEDPGIDIYKVDVIGDRPVSEHIETHFDIRHQSPQILWVGAERTVVWHGSHRAVSRDNLAELAGKSPTMSTVPPPVDGPTLAGWKHHLQDEADAAFLYEQLADAEPQAQQSDVYRRLAGVERRHVGLWRTVLAEHGLEVGIPDPSWRAKTMAWVARRFGPSILVSALLREEGNEVRGYLQLYRESEDTVVGETAMTLARESAEHAEELRGLTGAEGEPWHRTKSGGFLRNVVYGFNDGLTANFGLVAGVIGASVQPAVILVTGVAGAIADALSMGASGYLAAKSEREVYEYEIAIERDEIRLMPELEQEELALLYEAKGISHDQAVRMASEVMKDPERALAEKVREELRIGDAHTTPLREGWVTGLSTAVGAIIPVAPFFIFDGRLAIATAFSISMLSHFGVGAARSFFTGRSVFRSGFDMFIVGLGVAAVGYFVGELFAGALA